MKTWKLLLSLYPNLEYKKNYVKAEFNRTNFKFKGSKRKKEKIVDEGIQQIILDNLFSVLDLESNASLLEIKKQFREVNQNLCLAIFEISPR